jgi:hypothetical protein
VRTVDVICGPLSATTSTLAATRHDPTRHLIANEGAMIAEEREGEWSAKEAKRPPFRTL